MRFPRVFAAALAIGWLALSAPAFAETPAATAQCDCWCTSSAGAKGIGSVGSSAACSTACVAEDEKMIVCSKKASELPANNLRCFDSKESCDLNCQKTDKDGKNIGNALFDEGSQPVECPKDFHYCYCLGQAYTLKYNIPSPDPSKPPIGQVADLGSYINTVYRYLLGISSMVAIVMIMIGGLQYTLSAAGGDIKKAKERMQNAVIGLVLLFCAALILQTVNPRLLTLQPPRLPALKKIELITDATNCYVLAQKGHVIEVDGQVYAKTMPEKACGTKGVVKTGKDGKTLMAEGTVCTFQKCTGSAACVVQGAEAKCMECKDIHPDNGNLPASESLCARTKPPESGTKVTQCGYTHDPGLVLSNFRYAGGVALVRVLGTKLTALLGQTTESGIPAKLLKGACAEVSIDCQRINQCEDYDNQQAEGASKQELDDLYVDATINPAISLKNTCLDDPCKRVRTHSYTCAYDATENKCKTTNVGSGNTCQNNSQCSTGLCYSGLCLAGDTTQLCNAGNAVQGKCKPEFYCPDTAPANCVVKKGPGAVCEEDYECQTGDCAGNVYGLTEGNCTAP